MVEPCFEGPRSDVDEHHTTGGQPPRLRRHVHLCNSLTQLCARSDRNAIERELGQGGMATVYLARDLKHDRHVAVKVLHPDLAAALGAERFLAEIKTTANLQHPHILPLHDSGAADGFLFYVMPYVEGESLRDKLTRERQLPIDDAIRLTQQVASDGKRFLMIEPEASGLELVAIPRWRAELQRIIAGSKQ